MYVSMEKKKPNVIVLTVVVVVNQCKRIPLCPKLILVALPTPGLLPSEPRSGGHLLDRVRMSPLWSFALE